MANTIITIGRQFGSGGHEIGKLAAQKLGIECYDSRLIQLASEKSCIGMEHLKPVERGQIPGSIPYPRITPMK